MSKSKRGSKVRLPAHPKRVALLVSSWNHYGQGLIEGVWRYAQEAGPWFLDMEPGGEDGRTSVPDGWSGDGVIAQLHTRELAEQLKAYRVPIVNVSGVPLDGVNQPRVCSDAHAVMRTAVVHLREKGFQTIAFCGEPHRHFLDFWEQAYTAIMAEEEIAAIRFSPKGARNKAPSRAQLRKHHQHWLMSLPKPAGVIGWNTMTCRQLAMACSVLGLDVPGEVAILSLNNENLLGRIVHPPLSGVDVPVERIGYQAAAQLDRLMKGKKLAVQSIALRPLGVTTRQSTDVFAVDDPNLRKALTFIRAQAHTGIDVPDVLAAVPMARRSLERQFKVHLGRSPAEEIRRTRIENVRQLLGETDMSIAAIAERCGFKYVEHMIPVFKKYHGCTPLQYRSRAHPRARPRFDANA